MRLGILGGTFDPIHHGHLDVAHAAERALQLDGVWVAPAEVPPHRGRPQASAAHRFAMVALATSTDPVLSVSDIDMGTGGPSYTTETLDRLAARGVDIRSLFFIAGADAFRDVPSWKGFPALVDRCHFIVVSRPGLRATELRTVLPALAARMKDAPCEATREPGIFLVDAPTSPVSSTEIRQRLERGERPEGLPPSVADYIRRQHLYGGS